VHVVSATANRLLIINDEQEVGMLKYNKDIERMGSQHERDQVVRGDTLNR